MNKSTCKDLFPTRTSLIVFILYILLFVNQGILVTASQDPHNEYNYNIVTVVLMTEIFKLVASICLYAKDNSLLLLTKEVLENRNVLYLYFLPALLYCFYNNLSFVNLSAFDPTTYYLLLQIRVVVTAILFQILFRKRLSKMQWISLILLTFGCMLKQINFTEVGDVPDKEKKSTSIQFNINAVFILIQVVCSCLAGVYNEYLLKKQGSSTNIYVQNVFMYLDSIICNVLILILKGSILKVFTEDILSKIFTFKVLIIMINNSAIGIVTSFFLKTLNSILKTYASALELVLTAVLSYIFFGIPIYLNTVLAIGIVLYAVYLYSQNPVSNVSDTATHNNSTKEDLKPLTEEV